MEIRKILYTSEATFCTSKASKTDSAVAIAVKITVVTLYTCIFLNLHFVLVKQVNRFRVVAIAVEITVVNFHARLLLRTLCARSCVPLLLLLASFAVLLQQQQKA